MMGCPRCGEPLAQGQEYCLSCGSRLTGALLGTGRRPLSEWWHRVVLAALVATAGGVLAVAATGGNDQSAALTTATGGFVTAPGVSTLPGPTGGASGALADWPTGADGWTIVLASSPQSKGKKAAEARARQARREGLSQVGVLNSSLYASLHPGYWVVFSGVYSSEAEAASSLEPARKVSKTAAVRHVVP